MKAQGSHKQVKKAARSVSQRGLGAAGKDWKKELRQRAEKKQRKVRGGEKKSKITCAEAIEEAVRKIGMASADQIHDYLKVHYPDHWTVDSIAQSMMCAIVNLEPAATHWKGARTFLFMHEDRRFELEERRSR